MAVAVVMPALEMAQETGVLVRWLKQEGELVEKGEPLMEVETDKTTVEIESPAAGVLRALRAREGDSVPVGRTIGWILAPGEEPPEETGGEPSSGRAKSSGNGNGRGAQMSNTAAQRRTNDGPAGPSQAQDAAAGASAGGPSTVGSPARSEAASPQSASAGEGGGGWAVTPLARNIAKENNIDLSLVKPTGDRIEKADVLAYMRAGSPSDARRGAEGAAPRLLPASPKARRLATERGIDLRLISGSGPQGAVLAADVASAAANARGGAAAWDRGDGREYPAAEPTFETPSSLWQTMAARMSASWTSVPHFYLMREVDARRLLEWRMRSVAEVERRSGTKLTVTDLLVKSVGMTLRNHPRLNGAWSDGSIRLNGEVNVGIAVALEDGLVVPVIARADSASLADIAAQRSELLSRARARKLRPEDMANGTFTITNLGMYHVDAFGPIVNPPQAAILAVGRIAERVVPVQGKAKIRPMMVLTLSCDHRAVDGARAARFLDELVKTIQDPWRLLI